MPLANAPAATPAPKPDAAAPPTRPAKRSVDAEARATDRRRKAAAIAPAAAAIQPPSPRSAQPDDPSLAVAATQTPAVSRARLMGGLAVGVLGGIAILVGLDALRGGGNPADNADTPESQAVATNGRPQVPEATPAPQIEQEPLVVAAAPEVAPAPQVVPQPRTFATAPEEETVAPEAVVQSSPSADTPLEETTQTLSAAIAEGEQGLQEMAGRAEELTETADPNAVKAEDDMFKSLDGGLLAGVPEFEAPVSEAPSFEVPAFDLAGLQVPVADPGDLEVPAYEAPAVGVPAVAELAESADLGANESPGVEEAEVFAVAPKALVNIAASIGGEAGPSADGRTSANARGASICIGGTRIAGCAPGCPRC